jgi:phosphoglycerol transferase MdoB-like AlkP superfamily enzyme
MRVPIQLLAIAVSCTINGGVAAAGVLEVVEHAVPASLEAGSETSIALRLANQSPLVWSPADGYSLSYHWLDPTGATVVWDGRRSALPKVMDPEDVVDLMATVGAPPRPGKYLLQWDVVHEGVRWLSELGGAGPEPIPVTVFAGHAFAVMDGSAPLVMAAGSETTVELVVHNEGARTWRSDGSFAVAYHWLDRDGEGVRGTGQRVYWEGRRTPFPLAVNGGESVTIEALLVAPPKAGLWHLQWDLVEEGVCWFSDRADEPLPTIRVLIFPDPLASGVWWSVLVLLWSAAAVSTWRGDGRPVVTVFLVVGDIAWCISAVAVKQGLVLAETGARPSLVGWALIFVGAAAIAWATRLLPRRFHGWACWGVVATATLILWADLIYLRFFGDLPAAAAITGSGQLVRVEASVRELMTAGDLWLWLDLLPGVAVVMVADRLRRHSRGRLSRTVIVGVLALVLATGVAALSLKLSRSNMLAQVFRRLAVAEEIGIFNLHAVDGVLSVARRVSKHELEPTRYETTVQWFRQRAPQRAGSGAAFAAAEGSNLVMVQVESLQNFVIGFEIAGQEVTPFLNDWIERGLWFSNVTDQTEHGRSSDSELSTQVSLLPMDGRAAAFRYAGNDFVGLAEVLVGHGYQTFSAVPYDGAFWNRRRTHAAYGYQRSLFVDDFESGQNVGWGLSDRDFLDQAVGVLAAADQPVAAYLLTLSLHHPFDGFPAHLKQLDVGAWEETPFGNFLHTMHFFDRSLAAFVAALEQAGMADNTVIAVWGDHDAGFAWEEDIAREMGATFDAAGWYLSQEVPLFIWMPSDNAIRGERSVPAGHADVAPTLLALLGIDPAPYAFVGRNLLGDHGDQPVIGEYGCWRTATHLFLQGDGSLANGTCIELASMATTDAADCRLGFDEAVGLERVSALVLEHDLQGAIHRELSGAGSDR